MIDGHPTRPNPCSKPRDWGSARFRTHTHTHTQGEVPTHPTTLEHLFSACSAFFQDPAPSYRVFSSGLGCRRGLAQGVGFGFLEGLWPMGFIDPFGAADPVPWVFMNTQPGILHSFSTLTSIGNPEIRNPETFNRHNTSAGDHGADPPTQYG